MEELQGYVEHIIFANSENGYTVFILKTDTEEITCVGSFHALSEGEMIKVSGERCVHQMYGEQFSAKSYESVAPTDRESIIRYLGSGAVKGVGESLAKRIVDMFGEDSFRVIEEEPELLVRVKGISERKAREIAASVVEKQDLRRVTLFLQGFGISNNLAMKIYRYYGEETYAVLEENPYRLAEDIEGVGFKTADEIASNSNYHIDPDHRIRSGIVYTLTLSVGDGNIYLPKDELIERASQLLEVSGEAVELQLQNLSMDRKVVIRTHGEEVRVYSKRLYYIELECARRVVDLSFPSARDDGMIYNTLLSIAKHENIEADEVQLKAATDAILNCVSIITGGPGTGKTTTINLILKYFEYENSDVYLAAPTGRAAKRMTETTGYEASTIQRLLGLGKNQTNGFGYDRNEENPLEVDAIIIDEMSMVDLSLFNALLKAIIPGTRLIMVGDANQLPSVGPGCVLSDLIESGAIPVSRLEKIYRQSEESDIIVNAHKINAGIVPDIKKMDNDFFFLERDDINVILKHMVLFITEKLPPYVKAKPLDIQVLTPMRKGPLGCNSLNPILQGFLNPKDDNKRETQVGDVTFREGDKVMQIKNNYQLEWEISGKYGIVYEKGLGVFNGDMGYISSINSYQETMEVIFDDNHKVTYPFAMLDEIELAYAVTIHKSQGSEYPAVIIPLLSGPKPLMNRNLIYTALTRARKSVVILGRSQVFEQMIYNTDAKKRYSGLKDALKELIQADSQ